MTVSLEKSCSFGLLCTSFVKVYVSLCVLPPPPPPFFFGGGGGLIVFTPDHCFSIYFVMVENG